MKISLNWLKTYIEIPVDKDKLAEILTDLGLEVEGYGEVESVPGGLAGIVVGEVKNCEKHPNADRLSLCKVDIGEDELLSIICGAPNVATGQKVLVAVVGTTLYPEEGKPWKIKKGKIRGEVSEGMICAEDELGLGTDHSGIMVLSDNAKIGMHARDYFQLETDIVYEIALTPNRSDATSHIGVARDLIAFFRTHFQEGHHLALPDLSSFQKDNTELEIEVEIENIEACPRYSGLGFTQVEVKESPDWIKNRLKAIGVRPINNIVDITNFILHEYGQPLHAFDADKISGRKIIVKTLANGTAFITLDEQERRLSGEDLMICDGVSKPMCIGGVFGGIGSGVTEDTRNVFLESAHFNAKWIRRSSMRHMLRTDAAMCFEKGSDPNQTLNALKRAAILFREYANAKVSSDIVDVYPKVIEPVKINLDYRKLNRLVGEVIPKDKVHDIFRAMDMEITSKTEDILMVQVPTNKSDVTREVDLIEEILRIYGYNTVSIPDKIHSTIVHKPGVDRQWIKASISEMLVGKGYAEMMNLSMIESIHYKKPIEAYLNSSVSVLNTSNIHLDIMRPEMMLPALKSVAHNHNRRNLDLKLFEWGHSYQKSNGGYLEKEFLTLIMSGKEQPESWLNKGNNTINFYSVKKDCEHIFQRMGITDYHSEELKDLRFEYGLLWKIEDKEIARFGLVSTEVLQNMDIKNEVFYAEIEMAECYRFVQDVKLEVQEMSKYPSIRRDLALVIDQQVEFHQIEEIARTQQKRLLKEINLFDIYSNPKQLGEHKKSYAVSFIFEDDSKTLKDKEVDKIMNKLTKAFESKIGAYIRK